jgi:cytochrome P450
MKDRQGRVVACTFTPTNMQTIAVGIRERVRRILNGLPRNEVFDWVDLVSIEVTTQMLATCSTSPSRSGAGSPSGRMSL